MTDSTTATLRALFAAVADGTVPMPQISIRRSWVHFVWPDRLAIRFNDQFQCEWAILHEWHPVQSGEQLERLFYEERVIRQEPFDALRAAQLLATIAPTHDSP